MQVQREQSQEEIIQELQRQISELTDNNHFLRKQLEYKEQFTAMIAHELRAPLAPIMNYAQMLNRYIIGPKSENMDQRRAELIQRNTNVIISQARRLSRLVNDLQDASHLTSGQFTLARETCDIVALTHEIIEHQRPVAPYHTLALEAPDKPIVGYWDSGRLQQVLGNLLDNAIKYSDERTTITIHIWTTEQQGNLEQSPYVHASVHNQGISIPSAEIGQLFRPYARLQATSGARPGSGLGLYIARSIIEAHGGTLRLETHVEHGETASENLKGTTFSFHLPIFNEEH